MRTLDAARRVAPAVATAALLALLIYTQVWPLSVVVNLTFPPQPTPAPHSSPIMIFSYQGEGKKMEPTGRTIQGPDELAKPLDWEKIEKSNYLPPQQVELKDGTIGYLYWDGARELADRYVMRYRPGGLPLPPLTTLHIYPPRPTPIPKWLRDLQR